MASFSHGSSFPLKNNRLFVASFYGGVEWERRHEFEFKLVPAVFVVNQRLDIFVLADAGSDILVEDRVCEAEVVFVG